MLKRCVWFLFGLLSAPSAAWAGAWTLPQGTGQWFATITASEANNYFNGSGLASTPRYDKDEAQVLVEYGLTDRLTAIVEPELQHIDIAAPTSAERTGLGYTEFGARYGFVEDPTWVFSGQATLRPPSLIPSCRSLPQGDTRPIRHRGGCRLSIQAGLTRIKCGKAN